MTLTNLPYRHSEKGENAYSIDIKLMHEKKTFFPLMTFAGFFYACEDKTTSTTKKQVKRNVKVFLISYFSSIMLSLITVLSVV